MTNIKIERVCIHECCHAIVARLFQPRIAIEGITVNAELVKEGQDQGTLNVNVSLLNDEHDYTAIAMTLFAGVVGENMYSLGTETIRKRKEEIIADNKIIDWLFAGRDITMFRDNAYIFGLIHQVNEYKLKEFCLRFLIDFLSNKEVWSMVEKLCDELLKKDDLNISEGELELVFKQIGLDTLFDNKRVEYLKACYM